MEPGCGVHDSRRPPPPPSTANAPPPFSPNTPNPPPLSRTHRDSDARGGTPQAAGAIGVVMHERTGGRAALPQDHSAKPPALFVQRHTA